MRRAILTAFILLSSTAPAWAGPKQDAPAAPSAPAATCGGQYETAAVPYWRIVRDMMRFKAMFDNYDQLCTANFPEEMEALQPDADQLRRQVKRDIAIQPKVITKIFDTSLPQDVSEDCAADKKARTKVRKNFLSTLKSMSKTLDARMEKSARTIQDPDKDLKLCHDLKSLRPRIKDALGPDLSNPLMEMSAFNSRFMTGDAKSLKHAYDVYRATEQGIDAAK